MRRKLFVPTIALIALGATVALSARDRAQSRKDKSPVVTIEQPKLQAAPVDRPTPPAETPKTQSADPYFDLSKIDVAYLQAKLAHAGVPASLLSGPTFDNLVRKTNGDLNWLMILLEDRIVPGELTRQAAGVPANNTCDGATGVVDGVNAGLTNVGATQDGGDTACAGAMENDANVWYSYTATCTGTLTASSCEELGGAADFDTRIAIFEGACGAESEIGCDDDDGANPCGGFAGGFHSTAFAPVTAGTDYLITLGGFGPADQGVADMLIVCTPPPANDLCDGAEPVAVGGSAMGDTSTGASGPDAPTCDTAPDAPGVWYSVVGNGTTLTASLCDSASYDTKINVYENGCGTLDCVVGNDDAAGCGGNTSEASWCSTDGVEYLIYVNGWNGQTGDFTLNITSGAACGTVINEIRGDDVGADDEEYFELCGEAGESLDGLSYVVIGDGSGGSGTVESVTLLDGNVIPAGGYFLTAPVALLPLTGRIPDLVAPLTFENGDNVTHFLVKDFTGSIGDDLDADDDCVLDEPVPWSAELDRVALIEVENANGGPGAGNECHYGPPSVGPDAVASFPTSPGHVGRCEDCSGGWAQLDFFPDCGAPVGEVCATDADCEGFGCTVPSLCDAGTLICLPACTTDGDCPSGVCMTNGLCSESDTPGLPNVAAVCPVGSCCRVDGVCQDVFDAADCDEAGGALYTEGGLCSETTCPPPNDDCEDRIAVGEGATPFTTIGASTDGPTEACAPVESLVHNEVWYNYTATCTGDAVVTTCEELGGLSDFDTFLAIYDGCDCPLEADTAIACNDDDPNNLCGATVFSSTVQFAVTADSCYKVRLGGVAPSEGSGILNIECIDTGACCLPEGLTCQEDTLLADCTAAGGEFLGFGSTCEGVTCGGACCLDDAELSCQVVFDEAACDALGGAFGGSGSDCESEICGGACCLDGQVCQQTFDQPTCGMMGGVFNLVGSSCDTTICGGACCINCEAGDATCINTDNFFECDGEYQGDGTACDVNESCGECACPLSECDTLTQSALAFNDGAVRCASSAGTTDNGYARCFDLAAEQGGVTSAVVTSVSYIVGESSDGGDGLPENWQVDINIYESPGCPPSTGTAVLLHTEATFLTGADDDTTQTIAIPDIAVNNFLVVEVRNPNNGSVTPPDNYFFSAGENEAGECADTYLRAGLCGFPDWIPYSAIGFGGLALVLDVGTVCCGDGVVEGDEECEQEVDLLTNGSFDANGGSFDGWFTFGNAFISNPENDPPEPFLSAPASGKMFGQFNGQFNVGGVGQAFPAVAGESFVFDGSTFVWSNDPMVGDGPGGDPQGNWGLMKIAFFDAPAGGTEIGFEEILVADGTVAQDVWTPYSVAATAPAGTQRVEALFLYLQPEFDGGAYFFDNASFSRTNACCTAECTYEGAGTVCAAGDDEACLAEAVCDGASAGCPANGPAAGGTECRASAGPCDIAESCDGQNAGCPDDAVEDAGTVCNPGTGTGCLEDALCDGTNVTCPPNAPIVDCIDGDGCCAPGCNQTEDSDCIAVCGNGRVEDGEECDDGNLDNGDGCDENCILEPPAVPTVTEWGMICLMLALLAGIAVVFGRRRQVV